MTTLLINVQQITKDDFSHWKFRMETSFDEKLVNHVITTDLSAEQDDPKIIIVYCISCGSGIRLHVKKALI